MPQAVKVSQAGESAYNGLGFSSLQRALSASFIWSKPTAASVDTISVWLRKVGSPAFTISIYIHADNAGSPAASPLLTIATGVSIATIPTDYFTKTTFVGASSSILTQNSRYWVVIVASVAGDASNYIQWQDSDVIASGQSIGNSSDVVSWTVVNNRQVALEIVGYISIIWPALLFQSWPEDSNESPFDNRVEFDADTAPLRMASRYSQAPIIYQIPPKRISEAAHDIIETFWKVTTFGGQLPFDWTNPWPGAGVKTFRFHRRPVYENWKRAALIPTAMRAGGASSQRTCLLSLSLINLPWWPAS